MQNSEGKRSATSPLASDSDDKKQRHSDSFDEDATIIHGDYLSSTMREESSNDPPSQGIVAAIKLALQDPEVLSALSGAVTQELKKEMVELKRQLALRDDRIQQLEERLDENEQYMRRNNVRISGIPEEVGERTDELVTHLAEALGCDIEADDIDRSHRVGRRDLGGGGGPRPLLVKFVSYRKKRALVSSKKELRGKKGSVIFPALSWKPGQQKLFINDDLTATRARLAKEAREKKKGGKIQDTWVRDGTIFIKKDDNVSRITNTRQLLSKT